MSTSVLPPGAPPLAGSPGVDEPLVRDPLDARRGARLAEARREGRKRKAARGLLYAILLVGGLGMIFPFVWMIVSSIKNAQDIYTLSLIPASPTLGNYREVLEQTS
jgi:hypothetical protein